MSSSSNVGWLLGIAKSGDTMQAVTLEQVNGRDRFVSGFQRYWNSGAISSSVSACGRLSARWIAEIVSGAASGPSAVSATAIGSMVGPTRRANSLATSSRVVRLLVQAAL